MARSPREALLYELQCAYSADVSLPRGMAAAKATGAAETVDEAEAKAMDDQWSDYGCDDDDPDIAACAAELRGMPEGRGLQFI